jgi:hypothetical protein
VGEHWPAGKLGKQACGRLRGKEGLLVVLDRRASGGALTKEHSVSGRESCRARGGVRGFKKGKNTQETKKSKHQYTKSITNKKKGQKTNKTSQNKKTRKQTKQQD